MPSIRRRDLDFLLFELLGVEELCTRPYFAEHGRETLAAMLDTAEAVADEHFAPHAAKLDEHEPTFENGRVQMIPEVKSALDAYRVAGFFASGADFASGGMQLPYIVQQAAAAIFSAANISTTAYPFLTKANANLIARFGNNWQKATFLGPLLEGRWFGTMALTEPQAGSGLADIRTTAVPDSDGSYRVRGNKIYISGGEHELSENIVHLVLARIKGAPAGTKGISLFIVPRFLVNADGSLGARNDVTLGGLIHKLGYRGTTSTMLNFGEGDGAVGYLVGEAHHGLSYMFQMMNEARIGVGLGAAAIGYAGYLESLDYAKTRLQGRAPGNRDPASPPIAIIGHADVKRMLLAQKAYVEGGLALCLYGSRLVDEAATAESETERRAAETLLDLLTPIIKSWPSQWCLAANDLAIQIHGGYGYTREYKVERLWRDNRLNLIHEGTFGIQSLDLLGRKVLGDGGRGLSGLIAEFGPTIAAAEASALAVHGAALRAAAALLAQTCEALLAGAKAEGTEVALANSAVFLEMAGHVVVAWLWLRQALVAVRALPVASGDEPAFYRGKLAACAYFFRWELPRIGPQAALLRGLDRTLLDMQADWF